MTFDIRRCISAAAAAVAVPVMLGACATVPLPEEGREALGKINHFVVIYQENHSFDNLYGGWEGSDGLTGGHVAQVDQHGTTLPCLPQADLNLVSPAGRRATCTDDDRHIQSAFINAPFPVEEYITAEQKTCPRPLEKAPRGIVDGKGERGGCTMDLDHRFYQEQYQIDNGKMDRYVVGSNALGLTMGYYDTRNLPIYKYLHDNGPRYVIADRFFQSAFGGSFLNHQWLIAARTPEWSDAANDGSDLDLHSVVDVNGMPKNLPFYNSPAGNAVKDSALTASCIPPTGRAATPGGVVCGDFVINTIQPKAWPYDPTVVDVARRLPSLTTPTIGDRLTAAGLDWAWYSGGWANAEGDRSQPGYTKENGERCGKAAFEQASAPRCPDKLFQFHHQPFNYYAAYVPGSDARRKHLRDEEEFRLLAKSSAQTCQLKAVSFVKPLGADNEHPGYASERFGNTHLVDLVRSIEESACAENTMIIITYDEFGGQADHVPPPGPGRGGGPYDQWGPGTRIPALIISPRLRFPYAVDHAEHDTTSILATIEHRFGLAPLGSRDAAVQDLTTIYQAEESAAIGGK